jgi:hypothetical protein
MPAEERRRSLAMSSNLQSDLKTHFEDKLVEELLAAYEDAKLQYYASGLRLSAVEGGRFCEAAFRMLQEKTTGNFTPLGRMLDTEAIIKQLAELPGGSQPDSVRIHIPRALRVVYDIRNKRDAAHLADGIDPNLQDATFVASTIDWVLAEFVRLYHGKSADEAQATIESLVTKKVPTVEDFGGVLKVLKPDLSDTDHVLLLLYQRGASGALFTELRDWVRQSMRPFLGETLKNLVDELALVHESTEDRRRRYRLTKLGIAEVENKRLHQ